MIDSRRFNWYGRMQQMQRKDTRMFTTELTDDCKTTGRPRLIWKHMMYLQFYTLQYVYRDISDYGRKKSQTQPYQQGTEK